MNFDIDNFAPLPRNWFSTNIEYQGRGRAEFNNPPGIIEGSAKVRFDEFGESIIEMDMEELETEESLTFGLKEFFSGRESVKTETVTSLDIGGLNNNSCIKLTINTLKGTFSATDNIYYSIHLNHIFDDRAGGKLNFHILRSQFDSIEEREAIYWVLPLSNFISEFIQHHPLLDRHPLRIYPSPIIPNGLSQADETKADLLANQRNRLIIFNFNERLGFIEPLADFEKRKNRLLTGRERSTITAIMVGEIGPNSTHFHDLIEWFPTDLLLLLGLATGTEVGAPWAEFRDTEGKLVRRIHTNWGHPLFSKGHTAIREDIHCGTGRLLTQFLSSPRYNESYLRVTMKNIVKGGLHSFSVEDGLRHLFLGFDNLCEEYKVRKTLSISAKRGRLVEAALKGANKVITEIASQAQNEGDLSEAKILKRIAQEVIKAKTIQTGFGKNVIELLATFDLPDEKIVSAHYEVNPRSDKRKWSDVIPYYRGIVMHRSYFEFLESHHDLDDIMRIKTHLHDILIRIVFKIMRYDGNYQPTVTTTTDSQPVDWVKSDLPAARLGY